MNSFSVMAIGNLAKSPELESKGSLSFTRFCLIRERWAGAVAESLIALFIFIEAPVSGMSLNPARSVGSAVPAGHWGTVWVYLIAPVAGMQLAADAYVRVRGRKHLRSAKLIHDDRTRCIFLCDCHGGRQRAARPR